VFHISDLHMRSVDGPQGERVRLEAASRWRVLGDKWVANLAELRSDGVPFDLVVFTGDLGDRGHQTDYPRACELLKQTCAALHVPLDRLFVIPGNHDVDRTIQRAAWESLRLDVAKDPRAYSKWMTGEDRGTLRGDGRRDQILERQQAFWGAVVTELGQPALGPWHSPHGRLGYRQAVTLPGLSQPIQVIGLDTAWLAGDEHDGGELRLTEHQVTLLTTTEGGEPLPGFRLALMHHRLADLADAADARRLMADRVDVLLHGHQHEPAADVLQGPDHQLLVLATGCLYEGDEEYRYANTCQVIDLELDEQARPRGAQVRFRGWSTRGLFWGDDALLYESARGGHLRLDRGARGWRFDETGEMKHAHASSSPATPLSRSAASTQTQREFERAARQSFFSFEEALARSMPGSTGFVEVPTARIPVLVTNLAECRGEGMLWWTCNRGDLEVDRIERFGKVWLINRYEVSLNGAWILRAEPYWSVVVLRSEAMPSMGLRNDLTQVREGEYSRDYGAWFQGRYITANEYNDGYAEIDGDVVRLENADFRIRVLREWYFLLHPKMNALGPWSREADDLRVELGQLWQQRPPKCEDFEKVRALPKFKFY
jgi:3',5'-cyclic AMP phosphodiesterase CpdA